MWSQQRDQRPRNGPHGPGSSKSIAVARSLVLTAAVLATASCTSRSAIESADSLTSGSARTSPLAPSSAPPTLNGAGGQDHGQNSAAAVCPAPTTVGVPWDGTDRSKVPPPTVSFDGQQLVPEQSPTAAVVCVYQFDRVTSQVSHRNTTVSGDLSRVVDLAKVPLYDSGQACSAVIPDHTTNYRLGLTYPSGKLWISTFKQECASSSNGTVRVYAAIYPVLAEIAETGTWPKDIESLLNQVVLGTVTNGTR